MDGIGSVDDERPVMQTPGRNVNDGFCIWLAALLADAAEWYELPGPAPGRDNDPDQTRARTSPGLTWFGPSLTRLDDN